MSNYEGLWGRQVRGAGLAWGALCFSCSLSPSSPTPLQPFLPRQLSPGTPLASLIKWLCLFEACSSSSDSVYVGGRLGFNTGFLLVTLYIPPLGDPSLSGHHLCEGLLLSPGLCLSLSSLRPDTCWALQCRCPITMSRTQLLWAEILLWYVRDEGIHPKGVSWDNKRYT